ncbi:MAG TPA: hypothetical protein VGN14_15635 [Candidatus Elarobacter sp.]|jgi:hypothetical protein
MTTRPPAGWRTAFGPGSYTISDGTGKNHALVFSTAGFTAGTDVEAYAATRIAAERQKGAEVSDGGPTTACDGQPAHRWTIVSASTGTTMETKVLAEVVTGGLATAAYSHPQGVGDRRDALDAMESLCPGPFGNIVPAGWPAPKSAMTLRMPFASLESPDGTSTFIESNRHLATSDLYAAFEQSALPKGTVVTQRTEACGSGQVKLTDVRVGNQIAQVATAFLHHFAYRYVYTRPAEHEIDPGAERALTAFCRSASPFASPGSAPI